MKYMKLGSKPDAFLADGSNVRYVASELLTDIIVNVANVKFHLHKFPLISKSKLLRNLILRASVENADDVHMDDLPGGSKAFEICAKFCYGMTVTLNAYNVVAARCAAEYLEMTEDIEKGNLIYKIDVFLTSTVFRSWKDSIIVLQTTDSLLPWSEDLKMAQRCVDAIASKTLVEPSGVHWSYSYSKNVALADQSVNRTTRFKQKMQSSVPRDWWIEDICCLDVHLYKKVMIAVKGNGRMSADVIGEALRTYAIRWLPASFEGLVSDNYARRHRSLVETIILLLPSNKSSGSSCSFLLKLLKAAMLIGIEDSLQEKLLNRISLQLHKASMKDLLIPSRSTSDTVYDVHLVHELVKRFMVHGDSSEYFVKDENMNDGFSLANASLLAVGKLIDGYLAEIACDTNLPLSSFIDLSRSLPEAARPVHDELYSAIDIYLKRHPSLTKAEKKRICCLIDVKKLSAEACAHAAQNDCLPLRVVVQVLYFDQVRAAIGGLKVRCNIDTSHISARHIAKVEGDCKSLNKQLENDDCSEKEKKNGRNSKSSGGSKFLLPSRSIRMFDKFWAGKTHGNKSSETSGSSQSPPSASVDMGGTKSVGFSRHRRYSVS